MCLALYWSSKKRLEFQSVGDPLIASGVDDPLFDPLQLLFLWFFTLLQAGLASDFADFCSKNELFYSLRIDASLSHSTNSRYRQPPITRIGFDTETVVYSGI